MVGGRVNILCTEYYMSNFRLASRCAACTRTPAVNANMQYRRDIPCCCMYRQAFHTRARSLALTPSRMHSLAHSIREIFVTASVLRPPRVIRRGNALKYLQVSARSGGGAMRVRTFETFRLHHRHGITSSRPQAHARARHRPALEVLGVLFTRKDQHDDDDQQTT